MRRTLRTETSVFAATAAWAIPTARRIWISCWVMAPISPFPSRGSALVGRFARVDRDLRACLDRPEFPERERSEFSEPADDGSTSPGQHRVVSVLLFEERPAFQ